MSAVKANNYYDASGGSNAVLNGVASPPNSMGFRNRIINGAQIIDQRNAGVAVTGINQSSAFITDRFNLVVVAGATPVASGQRVTDAPTNYINSLKFTTTTASTGLTGTNRALVQQNIEGLNIADLAWGSASAATVTLSFVVKSSLTGTFGGALQNSDSSRSYPFTYTINAANTWEAKTVTIAGDTTGTWLTTNGIGIQLIFGLGTASGLSGTAGAWAGADYRSATGAVSVISTLNATWQVTGVQLEAGTNASPFERVDYGRQLIMCQRYFQTSYSGVALGTASTTTNQMNGWPISTGTNWTQLVTFACAMRTQPVVTIYNPNSGATGSARVNSASDVTTTATAPTTLNTLVYSSSSITAGNNVNYHYGAAAEL